MTLYRRIYNFLTSVKLAFVLIIFLTTGAILGVTVLKDKVFSSWWFLTLVACLFINTFSCTLRQASRVRRRVARVAAGEGNYSRRFHKTLFLDGEEDYRPAADTARALLRRHRYRLKEEERDEEEFYMAGRKYTLGYWGIVIFHLGLLVVMIGGFLTFTTSFWGSFFVLQGSEFTDKHQNYVVVNQGPWYPTDHRNFQIRLDDVILQYNDEGLLRDYMAKITVLEDGKEARRGLVSGPTPFQYKGLILYKKLYGYAPGLKVTAPDGKVTKFRVILDTSMNAEQIRHEGDFSVPGTSLMVSAAFYPDLKYAERQNAGMEAHREDNPGLVLTAKKGRELVFQGKVPLKESVEFRGYTLAFDNYLEWYGFSAVKDRGITVVFIGFWIALLGTAVIYLLIPREMGILLVSNDGGVRISVSGRTAKYKNLFAEEFEQLGNEIKDELMLGGTENG